MIGTKIKVTGGKQHERDIAKNVAWWCVEHFNLEWWCLNVNIKLGKTKSLDDCWGTCEESGKKLSYNITIGTDQPIRDFVATIVHEMVHVKQYATKKWKGTGEREANKLQYKLTDKLWRQGIL